MTLFLKDIWPIANLAEFKVHFARWNDEAEPLDVFARDRNEWRGWQEYYPGRNDFNRPYIFSLIQFYHEQDTWLFGGVFCVLARREDHYEVELSDLGKELIGRLKLRSSYRERTTRVNLENHYQSFVVQEILRESYLGRSFPGYDNINVSFEELEALVKNGRLDWKGALENVKGVYQIADIKTGKRYIGAAYGSEGIWSRWCTYVATGHGGNIELRALASDPDLPYCRANFRFTLLEHRSSRTDDKIIIERENFWKEALLSRGEHGLNRN